MKTPVSFEIAKFLKEKGFDNESAHYYNEKGEMLFDTYFPSLQPTKPDVYYDNPTIAEVVMWLYEKHGIWVEVILGDYGFFWELTSREKNTLAQSDYKIRFYKPTEAYSAAIEYTLKNLI